MTAKLTYSKVAELVQNLVKKGVNIHHPLIADEGAKIIDEYAEQQALRFEEFINQEYMVYDFDEDLGEVVFKKAHWPNSKAPLLTIKQLYQKFKEEQK